MRRLAALALFAFLPACTLLIGDRRQDATDGGSGDLAGGDGFSTDGGSVDGGVVGPICTIGAKFPIANVGLGSDAVALAAIGGGQFAAAYIDPTSNSLVAAILDDNHVVAGPTGIYPASGMLAVPRVARSDGTEALHFSVIDAGKYVLVTTDRTLGSGTPPTNTSQTCPSNGVFDDVVQVPLNDTAAVLCGGGPSGTYHGFNTVAKNDTPIVSAIELRLSRDGAAASRVAYFDGSSVVTGGFSVGTMTLAATGTLFSQPGLSGIGFDALAGPPPRLLVAAASMPGPHLVWAEAAPTMSGTVINTQTILSMADGRLPLSVAAWPRGFLIGYGAQAAGGDGAFVQAVSLDGQPTPTRLQVDVSGVAPAPQLAYDFGGGVGVAWRHAAPQTAMAPAPYFGVIRCQ